MNNKLVLSCLCACLIFTCRLSAMDGAAEDLSRDPAWCQAMLESCRDAGLQAPAEVLATLGMADGAGAEEAGFVAGAGAAPAGSRAVGPLSREELLNQTSTALTQMLEAGAPESMLENMHLVCRVLTSCPEDVFPLIQRLFVAISRSQAPFGEPDFCWFYRLDQAILLSQSSRDHEINVITVAELTHYVEQREAGVAPEAIGVSEAPASHEPVPAGVHDGEAREASARPVQSREDFTRNMTCLVRRELAGLTGSFDRAQQDVLLVLTHCPDSLFPLVRRMFIVMGPVPVRPDVLMNERDFAWFRKLAAAIGEAVQAGTLYAEGEVQINPAIVADLRLYVKQRETEKLTSVARRCPFLSFALLRGLAGARFAGASAGAGTAAAASEPERHPTPEELRRARQRFYEGKKQ